MTGAGALQWISELAYAFARIFPRLLILKATHGAVKFKRGWKIKPLKPGLHWYWPLTTEVVEWPTCRQTVDLPCQVLRTSDSKTTYLSGIVVYRIYDIEKLVGRTHDPDTVIRDVALAAIKEVVTQWSMAQIEADHEGTDKELTDALKKRLRQYGVTVMSATLSDFAPCSVFYVPGLESINVGSSDRE